jgi:signal transduction histidine kinase
MPADLVTRAFELFAQAQRTSERSQGGLGLGLALVKSIVKLHGGTVSAHSAGPGCGSSFTIRLPRPLDVPTPPRPIQLSLAFAH